MFESYGKKEKNTNEMMTKHAKLENIIGILNRESKKPSFLSPRPSSNASPKSHSPVSKRPNRLS
jgi:hypothetical protein